MNNTDARGVQYVPVTPAGTPCTWLSSKTEDKAWAALLKDAAHMPYKTVENFKLRGYTVERWEGFFKEML